MKRFILAAALLATIAPAIPSAAQVDTLVTGAAAGEFPPGTSFNGVPLREIWFGAVSIIPSGGAAIGHFQATLLGADPARSIEIEGTVTLGSSIAGTAIFSGLCTIDMKDGTPVASDVPFTVTAVSVPAPGSLRLVLGTSSLPTAIVDSGSITVE